MLVHLLALAVGLSSFALYMAAFFFPEVHRKNDLIWSGIGMFYALVLWFCAGQIRGALLLGQTASVSLLLWLGWQTLRLRRTTTPLEQQTLPMASPQELTQHTLTQAKSAARNFSFSEAVTAVVGTVSSAVDAFKQKSPPENSVPPAPPASLQGAKPPAAATLTDSQDRVAPLYEDPSEVAQAETPEPMSAPELPTVEPQPDSEMGAPPAVDDDSEIPIAEYVEIPKPQPAPEEAAPTPSRQPKAVKAQGGNKLVVLKDWLVDVVSSFRKPKTSRPMIEIPPREPSIPTTATANQTATLDAAPSSVRPPSETISEPIEASEDDWGFDDLEAAPEETTLVEVAADQSEIESDTAPEAIADAAAEIIEEENEALPTPEGFEPAANDLEVDAEEEAPSEAEVTEPVEEVPEGPIPTASDEPPAEEAKAEEDSLAETEVTEPVEEVPEGPVPTASDEPPADDADDNDDDGIPEDLTNTVSPLIGENLSEEELSELEAGEQSEAQTEPDAIAPEASFEVAEPPESEAASPEAEVEAVDAPANLVDVPTPPDLADLSPEPQPPVEEPVEIAPEVLADLSPDVETDEVETEPQPPEASEPEPETAQDTDDPRLRRPNPPNPDLIKAAQETSPDEDSDSDQNWID